MPLCSIAYCSEAAAGLTVDQLNALVRDAMYHNRLGGVTGVLLCDGIRFLQYLEGPGGGIDLVYSRVLNSRRHSNVMELARGQGSVRRFPYWSMHWIPVEQHELHAAAIADWTSMKVNRAESGVIVAGVELVSAIVANHR
ncbi:BLUF domain-containing protein [Stenotrophomonas rhizophila]